ncbi:unnamed protein product [Didymodactylos carnosus]|uniref:cAMP-regulated phosphoprotein 19 n=1 Tax=Didymodactylos carnosus TaxID=1234261 RepID=A0A815F2A6_9BILA|nr:unnamed protein product [Didymodactylos carnosus]CAF4164588.1 unnamed protein product [Didymodactylos carnosus]
MSTTDETLQSSTAFVTNNDLTPELTEEQKLRNKYGGALPRQQNMLQKKLLSKGGAPKYFDSGDYNMAKAQGKMNAGKPDAIKKTSVPETVTGHEIPTPETVLPRKLSCAAASSVTSIGTNLLGGTSQILQQHQQQTRTTNTLSSLN